MAKRRISYGVESSEIDLSDLNSFISRRPSRPKPEAERASPSTRNSSQKVDLTFQSTSERDLEDEL